jgi:hypothetical protein
MSAVPVWVVVSVLLWFFLFRLAGCCSRVSFALEPTLGCAFFAHGHLVQVAGGDAAPVFAFGSATSDFDCPLGFPNELRVGILTAVA